MTLPEPQNAERLKEIAARVERIVPRSSLDEEVVALYVNDVRWLLAQNEQHKRVDPRAGDRLSVGDGDWQTGREWVRDQALAAIADGLRASQNEISGTAACAIEDVRVEFLRRIGEQGETDADS